MIGLRVVSHTVFLGGGGIRDDYHCSFFESKLVVDSNGMGNIKDLYVLYFSFLQDSLLTLPLQFFQPVSQKYKSCV